LIKIIFSLSSNKKCQDAKTKKEERSDLLTTHILSFSIKILSHITHFFLDCLLEMVPPPAGDQDWQFDKFHDGGSKGTSA